MPKRVPRHLGSSTGGVSTIQALVLIGLSIGLIALGTTLARAIEHKGCEHTATIGSLGEGPSDRCGGSTSTPSVASPAATGALAFAEFASESAPAAVAHERAPRVGLAERLKRAGSRKSEHIEDRRVQVEPWAYPDGHEPASVGEAFLAYVRRMTLDGRTLSKPAFEAIVAGHRSLSEAERAAMVNDLDGFQMAILASEDYASAVAMIQEDGRAHGTVAPGELRLTDLGGPKPTSSIDGWNVTVSDDTSKAIAAAPPPEARRRREVVKPYDSELVAAVVEAYVRAMLLPAVRLLFGAEVYSLWATYLGRNPGDSLEPMRFDPSSEIAQAFAQDPTTLAQQRTLAWYVALELVGAWSTWVEPLPLGTWVEIPLETIRPDLLELRTNYAHPETIPGNVAGGISGSAAGRDRRRVAGVVRVKRTGPERVELETDFEYLVEETLDLVPGGKGSSLERVLTEPMKRLEATGNAFDLPFEVRFEAAPSRVIIDREARNMIELEPSDLSIPERNFLLKQFEEAQMRQLNTR